jgi:hypothetical protein
MNRHFVEQVTPLLQSRLDSGEILQGVLAAAEETLFKGGSRFAVGVTDRRMLLQPVDRRQQAKGEVRSISPEMLESVDVRPAPAALGASSVVVTFHTTDGQTLRLLVMNGGAGLLGKIGGGEAQREGVQALSAWLQARNPPTP